MWESCGTGKVWGAVSPRRCENLFQAAHGPEADAPRFRLYQYQTLQRKVTLPEQKSPRACSAGCSQTHSSVPPTKVGGSWALLATTLRCRAKTRAFRTKFKLVSGQVDNHGKLGCAPDAQSTITRWGLGRARGIRDAVTG